MKTLDQSINWLNQEDRSHLSQKSQFSLWQAANATLPDLDRSEMIDELLHSTYDCNDLLEHAEVLVGAAKIVAGHEEWLPASLYLQKAAQVYQTKNDPLRFGVTTWMLSLVEWNCRDHVSAYAHACKARDTLKKRNETFTNANDPQKARASWNNARLQEMDAFLAATQEEVYQWICEFEGSPLSNAAATVIDQIKSALRQRAYPRVYPLLNSLQEITHASADPAETAQGLAYVGLVYHQMGDLQTACRFIQQANSLYQPESHAQAMTQWMLALELSLLPNQQTQAIMAMQRAFTTIQHLKTLAAQRNRPQQVTWYSNLSAMLQRIR